MGYLLPGGGQAMTTVNVSQATMDLIQRAIAEDLAGGEDVTSVSTVDAKAVATAHFSARNEGVIAGLDVARATLESLHVTDIQLLVKDGDLVKAGTEIMRARGLTRNLLLAERTALNFLGHLSGIATLTHVWVEAVAGTKTKIRDTRKTTPGLRELEKYAVRMGGGENHRMSLSASALIKDNHIEAAGSVSGAFQSVRRAFPDIDIEIEVDTIEQLREILEHRPDLVLLDNMSPEQCAQAVALVAGRCKLEASGGISLDSAKAYAASGVDYIAIGALTHSAPVLDIGLDLKAEI